MQFDAKLEDVLQKLARDLRAHYKARFGELVLLEVKRAGVLELLLILEGEVNQVREILRVEPNARLASLALNLEVAVFPVARATFDAALEPELWEAKFTARVINAD
jgi:hypothetical protein